jgi:hypothetical protein
MRIYSRNVPDLLHWAQAVWRWSNRVLIMWRMWWFDGIWDAQSEPSSRGFSSARKRTLPLILLIWTSETQVMAKRRAGSRTASLTPDHKKSGIDPIYLATGGVPHIVGKLSTRLQLCFKLHCNPRSVRKFMGLQSRGSPIWRDFGTLTRESREK